MNLLSFLIGAFAPATLINCLPIQGNHEQNDASSRKGTIVSHFRVRRDVPLTARDIEEAGRYNIDLKKMYKHSVLKHSNGSDYSIWVHNSFDPDVNDGEESTNDVSALGKRSWEQETYVNDRMPNRFEFDSHTDTCEKSSFEKKTYNKSPFADGANAIIEWTNKNKGGWRIGVQDAYYSTDILIGGSNTGANMRFSVRKEPGRVVILGTKDVGDAVGGAFDKFKKTIKGVVRMSGKGKMKCWNGASNTKEMLYWEIDRSDRDIVTETESQEGPTAYIPVTLHPPAVTVTIAPAGFAPARFAPAPFAPAPVTVTVAPAGFAPARFAPAPLAPAPVTVTVAPAPVTVTVAPAPVTVTVAPAPVTVTVAPAPVTVTVAPAPVTVTVAPAPVTVTVAPAPVTVTVAPAPVTVTVAPAPVTVTVAPAPVTVTVAPAPVTVTVAPAPVTVTVAPAPVTVTVAPAPVTVTVAPAPVTVTVAPAPVTVTVAPAPVTVTVAPAPVTVTVAPAPVTVTVAPAPFATVAVQPDTIYDIHHDVEETLQTAQTTAPAPKGPPLRPPLVTPAPPARTSQSIPPGWYQPGEDPTGFFGLDATLTSTSSERYSGKSSRQSQSVEN
ncbi:hypothetical protein F52700_4646 [Fusarium sp. NRRL 52700]|nr:hypothetical protein F52700_4646 [Fusarium sp. NRRL 52700]